MARKIKSWEDASNLLMDVLQREINESCGVPEGFNADIEMEYDDGGPEGMRVVGVSVTDPDGNRVGGLFKDEDEVREYFKGWKSWEETWDELADRYVESVKKAGNRPSWDIVRTAFCAGMNEMSNIVGG